jgi:hypothetical protein
MPLALAQLPATITATSGNQHAANPSFPNGSLHAGKLTLIFRVRLATSGLLLHEHRLILMPARMQTSTEVRSALYYTQGGLVADTPHGGGVGATYFTIQGHTGFGGVQTSPGEAAYSRLTPQAFVGAVSTTFTQILSGTAAPPTSVSVIDGMAAIKDLGDTIRAYFDPTGGGQQARLDATRTQDLALEFLNMTAPISAEDQVGQVGWRIHPDRSMVDIQQDARQPFLYNYTLRFAALAPLASAEHDAFVEQYADPQTGLLDSLRKITTVVTSVAHGVNTLVDAANVMLMQNITGPITTFLGGCQQLGDAIGTFMNGVSTKLAFPLYARRSLDHIFDSPRQSVESLKQSAHDFAEFFVETADPRSLSSVFTGTQTSAGVSDALTLSLNHEAPQTIHLGTQTTGPAVAAAIQTQVQALTPTETSNASAYRDFTATYDATHGQYTLSSGTKFSDAASVTVLVPTDPLLSPQDSSALLGLGVGNGGQEHAGSAYPLHALALLRGVEQACTHLQAFPDYFADQLEAQDAALAALLPPGVTRPQIRGDQHMQQTRITPGDSLQGIAARVGSDWQTLALVNRLTYPYIIDGPTTVTSGRVSSADYWHITDSAQTWPVEAWQGQRLDIVSGPGAGQSRRILHNDGTTLTIETAWTVLPQNFSTYAIRTADNPVQRTGTVTSAGSTTLTDSSLSLVPGSQQGLTLVLTTGPTAGERGQVVGNDATTYTVTPAWEVPPPAGSLYLLLGPEQATLRQKVVGEWLSVPRPSAQAVLPIRSRLQDVSAITGKHLSTEEKLFGRDLLLDPDTMALRYDPALGDAVTLAGLDNLRAALIHYINVPIGELEYAPNIGSFVAEELGLTATLPLQIQLLASVERTIRQDGRIASMNGAQLVTQGGLAVIAFGATAINGATIERVVIR